MMTGALLTIILTKPHRYTSCGHKDNEINGLYTAKPQLYTLHTHTQLIILFDNLIERETTFGS